MFCHAARATARLASSEPCGKPSVWMSHHKRRLEPLGGVRAPIQRHAPLGLREHLDAYLGEMAFRLSRRDILKGE